MKLLLHIGTHKTATTSIQHFLTLNRNHLVSQGYFYPKNDDSAYVFNFLASRIAFGKCGETTTFLAGARKQAVENNCHTLVISGESFYAMTGFFIDIQKRGRTEDYWSSERRLIEQVKECCASFSDIRIACYLRPQDELASSLYNQLIKNTFGITSDYQTFLEQTRDIYDYAAHLNLWADIFGRDKITLKNFHEAKKDIISDFCRTFLNEDCFTSAESKDFEANTRLNRDVMEVKRLYNATSPDPALAYVSARSFRAINDQFPDQKSDQIFASPEEQKRYFSAFEEGNADLARKFGIAPLKAFSGEDKPTYPGLTAEKTAKIYLKFCEDLHSPRNRAELIARRAVRWIMEKIPGGSKVMTPIRKLHNSLRLRTAGW